MAERTIVAIFALASAVFVGGCDSGSPDRTTRGSQAPETCATEPAAKLRAVFRYLHQVNESEIRLGDLAADRAAVPQVRKFATQMVAEHAAADQKLTDLARREHLDLNRDLPADPIHAAALKSASDEEAEMQSLTAGSFEVIYVASRADQHRFALEIIEQGQRVAAGEPKSLLEDAREMASRHRDRAIMLLQDLHFAPRAVGGGPLQDTDKDMERDQRRPDTPSYSRAPTEPRSGLSRDDPMRLDAGVWPPITTPAERMPDLP
jgi:predicted outer membrane protein